MERESLLTWWGSYDQLVGTLGTKNPTLPIQKPTLEVRPLEQEIEYLKGVAV